MIDLASAARAVAGQVSGPSERTFVSVFTDSRQIQPDGLFVALRGARFDGHDFVVSALQGGAAAAMVDSSWAAAHAELAPLLLVEDTLVALGRLAADWRARFALPLIGVVGSNGKTTVKEMIASILRAAFGDEVLATAGNLNNAIGLPLTLLRLREHHRAAVVELGMNHPGETAQLASLMRPSVALINNAQREHQEFMASVEAVAREHIALIEALPADGVAVVNADDEYAPLWRQAAGAHRVIDFGLAAPTAAVRAGEVQLGAHGAVLTLLTFAGSVPVELRALGRHNVLNALAAAAASLAAGLPLTAIKAGLEAFRPVGGRLQVKVGLHGVRLIDDSYNANPDSLRAAIDVLANLPGRRILVIGDMGEVGKAGERFQAEIGAYAQQKGIDVLYALGRQAAHAAAAFGRGARQHLDAAALIAELRGELVPECTLLIKGSRFMRLERVVEALAAGIEDDPGCDMVAVAGKPAPTAKER